MYWSYSFDYDWLISPDSEWLKSPDANIGKMILLDQETKMKDIKELMPED